jgi:hypothetical protein
MRITRGFVRTVRRGPLRRQQHVQVALAADADGRPDRGKA